MRDPLHFSERGGRASWPGEYGRTKPLPCHLINVTAPDFFDTTPDKRLDSVASSLHWLGRRRR